MIPLRWHLVALPGLSVLLVWLSIQRIQQASDGFTWLLFTLTVLLVIVSAETVRRYIYYQRFNLITLRTKLAKRIKQGRMRKSELFQHGPRVLYRSEGKQNRRTIWSRLWIMDAQEIRAIPCAERGGVSAIVLWPRPFFGELLHCIIDADDANGGERPCAEVLRQNGTLRFNPQPIRWRNWRRWQDMDDVELKRLAAHMSRAIALLDQLSRHDHMLGSKRRFTPPREFRNRK